jgi:hypothetical protein
MDMANCFLELRDRIEMLEAAQQPPRDKLDRLIALDRDDPAGSLVERVADAIAAQATSAGIVNDRPARAAASIVQAFDDRYEVLGPFDDNWQELCLAAALRALAVRINGADAIHQDILDIAAELET